MRAIAGAMGFPPALWFEDIPAQAVLRVDVLEQRLDNKTAAVAGLSLDALDMNDFSKHAEEWEKAVRKVRTGMMPNNESSFL